VALLENPDQLSLLRRQPERIHDAVEECLRYDPPVQFIGRIAKEELEIRGKTLGKNHAVLLMLASANRDPEQFEDPDTLDITRKAGSVLSFGRGRHLCIGAPLVRAEVATGLSCILEQLRNLERAEGPLRWIPRMGHRWLQSLPVSFDPPAERRSSSR
jgi:cytochrome P450